MNETLTTPPALGDIKPGESRIVGVLVSPAATVAQGIYDDRVVITSTNHVPYAYNVQVTVTSSAVGSVMFDVINEFYEDVAGASVTLQHQSVLDLVYNLKTAADGTVMLTDIPEGRYSYNVSAANHLARSGSFIVTPGMTTSVAIAMEVNLVNVEWSVVPTTIVDKYDIRISQTFATNVPAPVLIAEPAGITVPQLQPGEVFNGEFRVTNYGLVAVYEVAVEFPTSHRDYDIEVMRDAVPARLEAMQSVVIPYRITRRAAATATALAFGGLPPNAAAGGLYACNNADLLKYGTLFDEVRGYGGSCFETIGIILSGKYVICPSTPAASTVTKAVNFALSFIADCVLGPISSAADLFYGTSNAVGAQSGSGTVWSPLAGTTYCGPGPGCTKPPCACPPPEPVSNDACMAYKCEGTSYVQFWKQGCKPPDKCNPWTPQCTGCNPGCQTSDNPCIITACENGVCKPRWKKGCVPLPCMPWSTASYCKACSPACVDDGNPCTKTYCDNGTCEHVPIEGCTKCDPNTPCKASANPCVNTKCVGGVCTEFWKKGCDPCERKNADGTDALTFSPEHCKGCDPVCTDDDNDACTREICYDGDCESMPIEGCRTCQEGCDDKDACTMDECNTTTGLCENTPIPDCQRCEPDGPIKDQPCKECLGGKITDKADGTCATGGKACINGTTQDVALASVNLLVNGTLNGSGPNGEFYVKSNDTNYFLATIGTGTNCLLDEGALEWSFIGADGTTTATGQNAKHIFASAGTYTVTLNAGCKCNPGATAGASVTMKVDELTGVNITTPITTAMNITAAPAMSNVTFNAEVQPAGTDISDVTFKWYLTTTYPLPVAGGNQRLPASGTIDIVGNGDWTPDWGSLLAGGNVHVYVTASKNGVTVLDDQDGYQIKGLNPARGTVQYAIGSDTTASRIACTESGYRQFNTDGTPKQGPSKDFGVFQITPVAGLTYVDVWNWIVNVGRGTNHLGTKRGEATNAHIGERISVNDQRAADQLPPCPVGVPPPLSTDPSYVNDQRPNDGISEHEREAIRRYNGGREHAWEPYNAPNCKGNWVVAPTQALNPNYVDQVLNCNIQ